MVATDRISEQPYGWVIVAVSTVCLALGLGAGAAIGQGGRAMSSGGPWAEAVGGRKRAAA